MKILAFVLLLTFLSLDGGCETPPKPKTVAAQAHG